VAVTRYRVADLGTFGGRNSEALGINNLGQVVGTADTSAGAEHAYLWKNGRLLDLGTLGGRNSRAVSINDKGQVVGEADTGDARHAFLWSNGKMHDLGTFGGKESAAYAINSGGVVVGTAQWPDGSEQAFLYRNGKKRPFNPLRGAVITVHSINNRGQIVGDAFSGRYQVFVYSRGRVVAIGRYAYGARAVGINDRGDIIGNTDELEATIATVWRKRKEIDLGYFCAALGINNQGAIVGSQGSDPAVGGPPDRAVVWENLKMRRLDEFLPEGAGWQLRKAVGINDRGQIVGVGTHEGKEHAFLLTPDVSPIQLLPVHSER
jgi:probable HAF family extracellular repeat protein